MLSTRTLYNLSWLSLAAVLIITRFIIVPANIQMPLITGACIYIGCHQSLKLSEIDVKTGKRNSEADAISKKDAMMFPVFGSIALFSLYISYKFLGKEIMNKLLTTYIMLGGVAAVANTIDPFFGPLFPASWRDKKHLVHFNIPALLRKLAEGQEEFKWHYGKQDVVTHLFGLGLAILFMLTKDFTVHNFFGMAFSIQALKLVSAGRFLNGFILLWGLFIYDIFWVFGTDVMVTVALSFEAPAKFMFPQSFEPLKCGILGLGDLVIPGIFISLCLRFDDYMHCKKMKIPHHREEVPILGNFAKPYFHAVLLNYMFGLAATALAMHFTKQAQPALLYLVPFTTASVAYTAFRRGEFAEMMNYKEDDGKDGEKAAAPKSPKSGENKKSK